MICRALSKLLVVGACATLCHRKGHNDALRMWADRLLARKTIKHKFKLTAVALANKVAGQPPTNFAAWAKANFAIPAAA